MALLILCGCRSPTPQHRPYAATSTEPATTPVVHFGRLVDVYGLPAMPGTTTPVLHRADVLAAPDLGARPSADFTLLPCNPDSLQKRILIAQPIGSPAFDAALQRIEAGAEELGPTVPRDAALRVTGRGVGTRCRSRRCGSAASPSTDPEVISSRWRRIGFAETLPGPCSDRAANGCSRGRRVGGVRRGTVFQRERCPQRLARACQTRADGADRNIQRLGDRPVVQFLTLVEVREPLRSVLATAGERLRLGDDPQRVFEDAQDTLPLPAFRLLTHYLSVQWHSGGSLAPGLYAIAETVRDRVNLSRRVHGQTAEARVSVFGVLMIVYGIALLTWTNNPERVEAFLASDAGGGIAAACVLAQAIGIVWMARLTRIDV